MKFLILGLLLDGPLSAYSLRKRFTAGISLFYSASLGSIQRALSALESQGWVTKEQTTASGRQKHLYSITEAGADAWRDWMLSPITESDAEQIVLAKVYLLGSLPVEDRKACLSLLSGRVATDLERLTTLRGEINEANVPDDLRDIAQFRLATLDYGMKAHELMSRWLGELESR